jgi:hypothetical protein
VQQDTNESWAATTPNMMEDFYEFMHQGPNDDDSRLSAKIKSEYYDSNRSPTKAGKLSKQPQQKKYQRIQPSFYSKLKKSQGVCPEVKNKPVSAKPLQNNFLSQQQHTSVNPKRLDF